jgi:protein SDA1
MVSAKGGGGGTSAAATGATSTGAGTKVDVTLKLSQLQNLCKRDPVGYREDYEAQIRRLESECGILKLSPQSPSPRLIELIQFAAAVSSSSYKGVESDRIANLLIDLLVGGQSEDINNNKNSNSGLQMTMPTLALQLHRDVRKTCVSALILMRNKGVIPPLRLLELFFKLLSVVADKGLRELLYKHMVNDIRNINKKGKRDDQVNRSIQSYLHRVISTHGQSEAKGEEEETATDIATKRATDLVCELYRRQVWTDTRTVAILASAVTSKNTTVMARAMRFFLNIEEKMAEDAKMAEEEVWDASQKVDFHRFSRKTNNRQRHVDRQLKTRKKQQRIREGTGSDEWMDIRDDEGVDAAKKLYPAIELLRDPQGLAEAVLRRLKTPKSITYKIKLLMMNFVTRLVGNHELLLLNLYPFLQKYMGGQQRDVTAVLAYTVQACHESVPPDEIYGILKTIAHNFVTERCSEEQMAVGINAIRAICSRVPSILSLEESRDLSGAATMDVEAFVRDIAAYNNHRDRSVAIAGKAFMNFIRETYPTLLQGKDRGLKGSALHRNKTMPMRFGEHKVSTGVEGSDLLVEYESKRAAFMRKKEKGERNEDEELQEEVEEIEDEIEEIEEVEDEGVYEQDEEEEAPDLVVLDDAQADGEDDEEDEEEDGEDSEEQQGDADNDDKGIIDLSKMSQGERDALKQHVSSTRVFSADDFVKMRKLVERERRARMDPREAARRKRAIAQGDEFDALSGDESSDGDSGDEEKQVKIKGAVGVSDIMAEATRKRQTKADKLQKVLAGREKFEAKGRAGGSTNTEKLRLKNFLMSKSSRSARSKGRGKGGLSENNKKRGRGGISNQGQEGKQQVGHEAKKRRRKV